MEEVWRVPGVSVVAGGDSPAEPFTANEERVEELLLAHRCCAAPSICEARCLDDEQSHDLALLVAEIDRLRLEVSRD